MILACNADRMYVSKDWRSSLGTHLSGLKPAVGDRRYSAVKADAVRALIDELDLDLGGARRAAERDRRRQAENEGTSDHFNILPSCTPLFATGCSGVLLQAYRGRRQSVLI